MYDWDCEIRKDFYLQTEKFHWTTRLRSKFFLPNDDFRIVSDGTKKMNRTKPITTLLIEIFFHFPHRFGSSSSQASQSSGDICRICHCESDPFNPLLTPCYCSGSLKYVHHTCLQQWLTASETNSCELCKFPFVMHTKIKPFNEVSSCVVILFPILIHYLYVIV